MKPTIIKTLLLTFFVALFAADGVIRFLYWQHQARYPTTSDATIKANVIPIASRITGKISGVSVQNGSFVKRGDILFEVDSGPYKTTMAQAKKQLEEIKAQVKLRQNQVNSAERLVENRQAELSQISKIAFQETGNRQLSDVNPSTEVAMAQEQLELAITQLDNAFLNLGKQGTARAKIKAAEEALATAKINLEYAYIAAPTSGVVTNLKVTPGSPVTAQQELFTLIENNEWWVNASFKPSALKRIHQNQPALIQSVLYPNHNFSGVVEKISANLVKIKILDPAPNFPLKVGENCRVTIDTQHSTATTKKADLNSKASTSLQTY